ncbi:coiled-coil domain-containing protein 22-like [Neltuma alba]|uniref:coiled-coil domain-containing protein 22-like n=1 Tax=Neltuma alba TaxID=207710 RepID=UPI0010A4BA25|nr:coiled-coil domain-containing protein 22-like [Prosopis alba]
MEEELPEIFLKLKRNGIVIPSSLSPVRELSPSSFVSICAQCLNSIDDSASIPISLPSEPESERVRICTDISSAVRNLGYAGDISFDKFLDPSEEDLYNLTRFMAQRISESSETGRIADTKNNSKLGDYNLRSSLEGSSKRPDDIRLDGQTSYESKETNVTTAANLSSSSKEDLSKDELTYTSNEKDLSKRLVNSTGDSVGNEETDAHIGNDMPVLKLKTRIESEKVQNQDKAVIDDLIAMPSELEHLEQELDLTTVAAEMVLNDQHSVDFYVDQLNEQLQSKRNSFLTLESEWDAVRKPLEEKRRGLQESLFSNIPEAQEMLQQLKEVEQEEQSILSEIQKRDEEYSKLSADLGKQPKVGSRKSYVERIKEITKNSRKQDADIQRILKETREVQLESNSIQERLHRTYAVADEIIFREAKKDPMGRQVYRLLTSIHESFEQMSEEILATDRIQREVAEYEMKLAVMASRNLDADKKNADLDARLRQPLG